MGKPPNTHYFCLNYTLRVHIRTYALTAQPLQQWQHYLNFIVNLLVNINPIAFSILFSL